MLMECVKGKKDEPQRDEENTRVYLVTGGWGRGPVPASLTAPGVILRPVAGSPVSSRETPVIGTHYPPTGRFKPVPQRESQAPPDI